MATELGSAYVQIVPSADGIQGKIENSMSGAAEKAGATIGQKMGGGIGNALKTTGAVMAGLGAAAAGAAKAIWDSANATAQVGDTIDKQSQKMGVSAEQYQTLQYAAEHSGISINKFLTAAAKVAESNFDGNVYDYVSALQAIEDPAERDAEALKLLGGKLANELKPLINGEMSLDDFNADLSELGGIMSNEAVASSAAFEDALTDMSTALDGFKNSLMSQALPGMTEFIQGLSMLVSGQEGATEKLTSGAKNIVSSLTAMIPQLIEFVKSIGLAILEAAPEIIRSLGTGIITALPEIVPVLLNVAMEITTQLINMLPQLVQTGIQIIVSLMQGLTEAIPLLIPAIIDAVINIIQTFIDNIPLLIDGAIQFFSAIVEALPDAIIKIIDALPKLISSICNALITALPQLIKAAFQMFIGLVKSLPMIIKELLAALPSIIESVIGFLTDPDSLIAIIEGAIELFMAIVSAIPEIVIELVKAMPQIIQAIGNGLSKGLTKIGTWGKDMAAKAGEGMRGVIDKIKSVFSNIGQTMLNIGKNLVEGIWNGISGAFNWIKEKITGWVGNVVDFMKGLFGIHSPSTLFRDEIGVYLAYGLGEGFDEGMDDVNKEIDASLQHTYAVAPQSVANYDFNNEGIGSEFDRSLESAMSRIQSQASPVIEFNFSTGNETLYKAVMKGQRDYNGRYTVQAAY